MQIGRELDPCWQLSCCPHPPLETPHPSWFHFALHIWFNKTPFNSVTPKNMMTNIYFKEKKTFLKKVLNQFFYCFLAHVEYPFRMWISWFCAAANKHDIFKYMLNVSSECGLLGWHFFRNVGWHFCVETDSVDMFHFASLTTWLETWDTTIGMHNMGKGKRPKHFFQPKNLHLLQPIDTGNMATYKFALQFCIVCMHCHCSNDN